MGKKMGNSVRLANIASNLDFSLKVSEALSFLLSRRLVVDVHRCGDIGVTHNLLDDFQIRFVLTKPGAKSMSEDMYREMRKQNWLSLFFLGTKRFFLIVVPANPIDCSVDGMRTHNITKPILKAEA